MQEHSKEWELLVILKKKPILLWLYNNKHQFIKKLIVILLKMFNKNQKLKHFYN